MSDLCACFSLWLYYLLAIKSLTGDLRRTSPLADLSLANREIVARIEF